MFRTHPKRTGAFAGGAGHTPMGGIVASCCGDLDATISDSYSGSGQSWLNIETTPSDSASQSAYDFHLGAGSGSSTDDPTFTGSAGSQSAYFSLDGGDHFQLKAFSATQAALWMAHRTDSSNPCWVALAFQTPTGANKGFWGTGWSTGDIGIYNYADEAGATVYSTATGTSDSLVITNSSFTGGSPSVQIFSMDCNGTTNNFRNWTNTKTGTTQSKTWQAQTVDPDSNWQIGASDGGTPVGFMLANTRIYACSFGDEFLDDTKAGAIIDEYNLRHNRTYA